MNQRVLTRRKETAFASGKELMPVLGGSGVFEGYASLFHARDGSGDIVMPGAFVNALKRKTGAGIRMLFNHDPSEPVGSWIDIKENTRGLFVRGRLNMNVQRGRELFALLEGGGLDGLSIGFRAVSVRRDKVSQVRRLLEIDLWEISLVTFPMLEGARVSHIKARAWADAERYFHIRPNS
jgi:uncharacterized protein